MKRFSCLSHASPAGLMCPPDVPLTAMTASMAPMPHVKDRAKGVHSIRVSRLKGISCHCSVSH